MAQVSEIVAELISAPVPVLLTDACAILDIVRALLPGRKLAGHLIHVNKVLAAVRGNPTACTLVKASITNKEFNDHVTEQCNEVRKHLMEVSQPLADYYRVCAAVGVANHPMPVLHPSPLPNALEDLGRTILNSCRQIDHDQSFLNRAYYRAVNKIWPAKNGAIKDSVMTEEYLELARQLRAKGFSPPIVFVSSNTNDFCSGAAKRLDPHLQAEFDLLGIEFCLRWPEAVSLLGL